MNARRHSPKLFRFSSALPLLCGLLAAGALAFTLPAPRAPTPREVFDLPSTESWIEQEELTPAMETAQHFHVVAGTNAQGVDFEIRVALPALRGAFWRALLMISDGNGQTNICPIAHTTGDTGEITFATFSVAKQCLPSSKFQVWFHVDPDRARVYWFWLRHFSKAD